MQGAIVSRGPLCGEPCASCAPPPPPPPTPAPSPLWPQPSAGVFKGMQATVPKVMKEEHPPNLKVFVITGANYQTFAMGIATNNDTKEQLGSKGRH